MTAPHSHWSVLPHGKLQLLEDSILTVTGTVKMPVGTFERRMTAVRLKDGDLLLYSPIALDEEQMGQLESFGRPAFLIVPGSHHRVDVKGFMDRYPGAKVIAAPGALKAVEEIVTVDATAMDFADPAVTLMTVPGTSENESALEVSVDGDTTLILNDILASVQNATGVSGVIARLFGFAGERPQIPLPEKMSIIDDKNALAGQFRTWAQMPLKRIVVSHGEPITDDPAAVLREVAATLT